LTGDPRGDLTEGVAQSTFKLPEIPEEERTPLVVSLLEIIHYQQEMIQGLKDEVARLKEQKTKPKLRPSALNKKGSKKRKPDKRPGSKKRNKLESLEIHDRINVSPEEPVPVNSRFKGYQTYTVQDLVIAPRNTVYRLERWRTPDGKILKGKLPDGISGHFGATLTSFILYQYYHAHVTQPLLWEQLVDLGVDISVGQLNRIITEGNERFHEEKAEILRVGLEVSSYVNVDDTGARHRGKNGYCTHIGNELFAYFESTGSKSRRNFLQILRQGHKDFVLSEPGLELMGLQKMPKGHLEQLRAHLGRRFEDDEAWQEFLLSLGITKSRHVRIATEGALLGSVLDHGVNPKLIVVSDDAGQFNLLILLHALCWIHAERLLAKLVGFNENHRNDLAQVRGQIWDLYQILKLYKQNPNDTLAAEIRERYDFIFTQKTSYETLNQLLTRLNKNKSELLLVLEHPELPLHNNLSEGDVREYVKKRKISGSTRSDDGRRSRDSFASLKKTCRKLGVSFWHYLKDRVSGLYRIEPLSELIRQRAQEAFG